MNKVYAYILTCLGIIIVLITITFKNNNKIKKIEQERKNKMIEYCNDIYTDLNEEGEFELNLNDIETIYNFDISLFKDKCSLEKTTIKATIKENKLTLIASSLIFLSFIDTKLLIISFIFILVLPL